MFDKLLIANRGEIACRIIRTARRLGIGTVAVYSAADADALHVELADEALAVGPAPAPESYLRGELLIAAARRSGAAAIHPGYGFLAENASFAEDCSAAGLIFIGPPPTAIRAMGDKSAAKELMARAGVPVLPGYQGNDQEPERLARTAAAIGFPVLIKPSAGGGGKGMRVVADPESFAPALAAARREAQAAFGNDRVLLEKYLPHPRHVEIQIFADSRGGVVHLFERDCSLQRRYQKIIEEAPAPGLSADLRRQMGKAATEAARAIGYQGAGTVEFLLAGDGTFFFMEMNTRLQVEHPVTEMITGQDLVEWQLRVAAGESLPCRQEELSFAGHAIEVRLYAEDPARDFLPATGTLQRWLPPVQNRWVRLDTGVRGGDAVTPFYDPLLAKLITWGEDRETARRRLGRALAAWQVGGVTTNLELLAALVGHHRFVAGPLHTAFVDEKRDELLSTPSASPDAALALAALELLLQRQSEAVQAARESADPWSPWHQTDGWRLNGALAHRLKLRSGGDEWGIVLRFRREGYLFELPGGNLPARGGRLPDGGLWLELGPHRLQGAVLRLGAELTVALDGRRYRFHLQDPAAEAAEEEGETGALTAPMPGRVLAVMVTAGERVRRGAPLMVLEAMKMEHTVTAPRNGLVTRLHFQPGALVSEGDQLLALETEKGG